MTEVVSVRFNARGKAYYFNPGGLDVPKGEYVIVETANGLEYGECTRSNHMVNSGSIVEPFRPVVRVATEEDKKLVEQGKIKEKEALEYCQKKVEELGIEMKLVDAEYGFGGNKILFFFTSEGRVDFRELVRNLASEFRTRIELRQIGVRDEAKLLGGLAICGRELCCSKYLTDFHPVSIKMAKTQGLSLNPIKISGTCGRLMCCLKYEENAYEDIVKRAPKVDAFVETPFGKGSVTGVNLLRGTAKVRLEDGNDTTLKTMTFEELNVLGGKGRRAEYIVARDEGKLEEAGFSPSVINKPRISYQDKPAIRRSVSDKADVPFNTLTEDIATPEAGAHLTTDRPTDNRAEAAPGKKTSRRQGGKFFQKGKRQADNPGKKPLKSAGQDSVEKHSESKDNTPATQEAPKKKSYFKRYKGKGKS